MFQKTIGYKVFIILAILIVGSFVFLPLLWLINTALKPSVETFTLNFFTGKLTLENFKNVITDIKILTYLKNSMVISFASSFMATLVSALAGYSFSKFRYRGRNSIMTIFMLAQAFPQAILLLSIYSMMMKLGMLDNYWSLVLSYVVFTLPVGTWTMKSYFDQLPNALIESAKVDGAGHFRTMMQIIFPLAVPGMISIAIYGFVWSWNDLLYSLTLVTDPSKRTLAPGLVLTYLGEFQNNWSNMMAAAVVVSIPVTIIFIFLQRYFIQGLTSGAVKG